jgi:hypothetical protein
MTELTCSKQLSGSGSEKIDHMKEAFLPEWFKIAFHIWLDEM